MSNDVIAYEDLRVATMVKNRHLSKSISDAGWRTFRTWLEYLARVYGKVVVAVPPQCTTQECSRCGTLVRKTLSERTHVCPKCGLVLGRDHNAGFIILSRGLALLGEKLPPGMAESHAWGEGTRYPDQAPGRGKAAR
jgi:putative transposase